MKTKPTLFSICFLLLSISMNAQKTVKLWNTPPTENGLSGKEIVEKNGDWVSNISQAEIEIFLPENKNTGMAVVICPGGGYAGLAFNHEGREFAKWLNTFGVAGIVLKYRMPNGNKEVPLDDAWKTIRYVREHAQELNIKTDKVGIAGFSAGGHLAATASTHFVTDSASTRPDFSILFYPVITMTEATHGGSKQNLLGDNPSEFDVYMYSNEKQVNEQTPPTILLLSDDDNAVPPINSTAYYDALNEDKIPATMYIFPTGGHGWGMRDSFKYHNQMLELLKMWIEEQNRNKPQ